MNSRISVLSAFPQVHSPGLCQSCTMLKVITVAFCRGRQASFVMTHAGANLKQT